MRMDSDVFKKAREVDSESIERVCSIAWKPLYSYVFFKVKNREEAEDVTQETFVRALSSAFRRDFGSERYLAYLKKIALNILRDRWRSNKRRGVEVGLDSICPETFAVPDTVEDGIRREQIERALNLLSRDQRAVIILRVIRGYPVSDTAKLLGKKEGTIRVIQHRALSIMADLLEDLDERGGKPHEE